MRPARELIDQWRADNFNETLTEQIICDLLGVDTLQGADLRWAYLHRADLTRANLQGADLRQVDLPILALTGLHPYQATFIPTPHGWHLRVGCWYGTADQLRELIAKDTGWPEAEGDEIERRRPGLEALADLCDNHAARHQGVVDDLKARWTK